MEFKEWFAKNLTVSGYPTTLEIVGSLGKHNGHDVYINVSDEFQQDIFETICFSEVKQSHWFPLGEFGKDMGIVSIFGALQILYNSYRSNQRVLLHCHAGINRSQTVAAAFYYLMTKEHLPDEPGIIVTRMNMMIHNCGKCLPELPKMQQWLTACRVAFEDPKKLIGGMYDWTLRTAGIK